MLLLVLENSFHGTVQRLLPAVIAIRYFKSFLFYEWHLLFRLERYRPEWRGRIASCGNKVIINCTFRSPGNHISKEVLTIQLADNVDRGCLLLLVRFGRTTSQWNGGVSLFFEDRHSQKILQREV